MNNDTFEDLVCMLIEWWDSRCHDSSFIQDRRYRLQNRKDWLQWMFSSAERAEQVRKFLIHCEIVYESEDEREALMPYENNSRYTLEYFNPHNEVKSLAREGGLENYYEELLKKNKEH